MSILWSYMVIFGWASVVYTQGTLLLQDPFDAQETRTHSLHQQPRQWWISGIRSWYWYDLAYINLMAVGPRQLYPVCYFGLGERIWPPRVGNRQLFSSRNTKRWRLLVVCWKGHSFRRRLHDSTHSADSSDRPSQRRISVSPILRCQFNWIRNPGRGPRQS